MHSDINSQTIVKIVTTIIKQNAKEIQSMCTRFLNIFEPKTNEKNMSISNKSEFTK